MKSIRRVLLISLLGSITLGLLLSAAVIYRSARTEIDELFDYQLRQLALSLRDQAFNGILVPPERGEEDFDFVIQVWNGEGVQMYYSHPHRVLPGLASGGYATLDTPEGAWRVFGLRWNREIIQVAQPMRVRNTMAFNAVSHVLYPLFLLLPGLSLLIWILVSRGLAPLRRLAREVATRTPEALDALPEYSAPEEVRPLVHSLNDLLGRLAEALAVQKAFIADAAHELRTPIAALQLQAQIVERAATESERSAALADLQAGIRRAGYAVQQLLTLARQDPAQAARPWVAVPLAALARQVITEQLGLAHAKALDLGLAEADESVSVAGDAEALRVLLANLVGNAVRYTPPGGRVDIAISRERGRAALAVSDSGPGIPEPDRQRVFDRFYRGEYSGEPGTGLGLAIVKAIAERHGATVRLGEAEIGGLDARVEFPADSARTA